MTQSTPPVKTPFQFLDYYEEADAARFAGREREIVEIADAVLHAPTLIVYGKSGLGKTSLLLAGVFPELRARACTPVHVRTLQDPIGDLLREVTREEVGTSSELPEDGAGDALDTLIAALKRLSVTAPVVLVLDQFEEFFIRFRSQRAVYEAFVAAIGRIAADRALRVHVVFSLREEYLADLDDFRAYLPMLFENEYRLRPMTAFGVRQTITRPLEVANIPFDPRLITKLVDRLAMERFDSVMLQILCQEVFERAEKRSPAAFELAEDDLIQAGDIEDIFRRYLNATTQELPSAQHLQARVILRALTTQDRTKQALRLQDFMHSFYRLEEAEVLAVLNVLRAHRMLRVDIRGRESWYELTHERLVPILDKWLRLDQRFTVLLSAYDMVATPSRADVWRQSSDNLLPTEYLDVVGPFRDRFVLNDNELELLVWSAMHQRHQDIEFWARRFGVDRSRKLVFEKLSSAETAMRLGAAFAAARISKDDKPCVERLLELSLGDPDLLVQREAGLALAYVGSDSTDQALRNALADPRTRKAALETLADLCSSNQELGRHFSWIMVFRARRIARARIVRDKRALLGDAARDGLIGGVLGAFGWTCTVAFVYSLLLAFLLVGIHGGSKTSLVLTAVAVALFASLILSALMSAFTARSVATRILLTRDTHLGRSLVRSPGFLAVPVIWGIGASILMYVAAMHGPFAEAFHWGQTLTVLALPVLLWFTIPLFVRCAQLALPSKPTLQHALTSPLVASAGLPFIVSWVVWKTAYAITINDSDEGVGLLAIFLLPLCSGLVASIGSSLTRLWVLHGNALCSSELPPSAQSRRTAVVGRALLRATIRKALPLFAAIALVLTLREIGPGALPFQFSSGTLRPETAKLLTVEAPARKPGSSIVPKAQYRTFRLEPGPKSDAAIVQITGELPCRWYLDGEAMPRRQRPIVISEGRHEFSTELSEMPCKASLELQHTVATNPKALNATDAYAWVKWRRDSDQRDNFSKVGSSASDPTTTSRDGDATVVVESKVGAIISYSATTSGESDDATVIVKLRRSLISAVGVDNGSVTAAARCEGDQGFQSLSVGVPPWQELPKEELTCMIHPVSGRWTATFQLILGVPPHTLLGDLRSLVSRGSTSMYPAPILLAQNRDLAFADLSKGELSEASLHDWLLSRVNFSFAQLHDATLRSARADFANFLAADLANADLSFADLRFAHFERASLTGASFAHSKLQGANFASAIISLGESDDTTPTTNFNNADLTGVDLSHLLLHGRVTFKAATLARANLSGLDLTASSLENAELDGADLTGALTDYSTGLTPEQVGGACGSGLIRTQTDVVQLHECHVAFTPSFAELLGACGASPQPNSGLALPASCRDIKLGTWNSFGRRATWTADDRPGSTTTCSCPLDPALLTLE